MEIGSRKPRILWFKPLTLQLIEKGQLSYPSKRLFVATSFFNKHRVSNPSTINIQTSIDEKPTTVVPPCCHLHTSATWHQTRPLHVTNDCRVVNFIPQQQETTTGTYHFAAHCFDPLLSIAQQWINPKTCSQSSQSCHRSCATESGVSRQTMNPAL